MPELTLTLAIETNASLVFRARALSHGILYLPSRLEFLGVGGYRMWGY